MVIMARSRFATAREVISAFPFARYDLQTKPTEQPPVEFIRSLAASGAHRDAVSFCAYVLPRREAVWWACQCARASGTALLPEERDALDAAEAWVRTPEEDYRQAALNFGTDEPTDSAAIWACRAAAFSGGIVSNTPKGPVRAQPEATARAARAAVLIAAATVESRGQDKYFKSCIDECLRLLQRDEHGG
jgi:hypothetical protein